MRKTKPIADTINPGRWIGCGGVFCVEVAIVHSIACRRVDVVTILLDSFLLSQKPAAGAGYPT
ncbi:MULTISPECIES: hypothetical protein [Pseudomonas]|uniref:hypothetical protein n=1 Tax=Pseudomonas TaxID=286 RepID=UPI00186412EA|nr:MULTISPECIES: hypothetical protein [Pseudomonas]